MNWKRGNFYFIESRVGNHYIIEQFHYCYFLASSDHNIFVITLFFQNNYLWPCPEPNGFLDLASISIESRKWINIKYIYFILHITFRKQKISKIETLKNITFVFLGGFLIHFRIQLCYHYSTNFFFKVCQLYPKKYLKP